MSLPGRFGSFVLGGYSYMGEGTSEVIEPYPILHVTPALVPKVAGATFDAATPVTIQKVNGYDLPLSLAVENPPLGFTNFSFSVAMPTRTTPVELRFRVAADAPHQGAVLTLVGSDESGEVARASVFVAVSPPAAFVVINGQPIPVTESDFQPSLEVLGDKERARDGTMQSTVRGVKRAWTFSLPIMPAAEYAVLAALLFTDLNRRRVLSGGVVPGEAVPVLMTPREPEYVKAGGQTLVRLRGQLEEA